MARTFELDADDSRAVLWRDIAPMATLREWRVTNPAPAATNHKTVEGKRSIARETGHMRIRHPLGCLFRLMLALLFLPLFVIAAVMAGALKLPSGKVDRGS